VINLYRGIATTAATVADTFATVYTPTVAANLAITSAAIITITAATKTFACHLLLQHFCNNCSALPSGPIFLLLQQNPECLKFCIAVCKFIQHRIKLPTRLITMLTEYFFMYFTGHKITKIKN